MFSRANTPALDSKGNHLFATAMLGDKFVPGTPRKGAGAFLYKDASGKLTTDKRSKR